MPWVEIAPNTSFTNPAWAKDYFSREHVLPGGAKVDASQFPRENSVLVTADAQADIGDAAITVVALSGILPAGTILRFRTSGTLAYVTEDAAAAATSVVVQPLTSVVPEDDDAYFLGTGRVFIPDGTLLSRTYTQRNAGTGFHPADSGDDEFYLLLHPIDDASLNNDADLYRHGSAVAENFVPGFSSFSSALQNLVRTLYECTLGAD